MPSSKPNYFQRRTKPQGPRSNERIRALDVQVIGSDGVNLGVLPLKKAIEIAKQEDLDLIARLNDKVEEAFEKEDEDLRFEEAQTLMQDAMDLIVDSDALAAADLRKGFSDNIDALPGEMQMRREAEEAEKKAVRAASYRSR